MDEASEEVLRRAAADPTVDDEVFMVVSRALRGRDPITGEPWRPPAVSVRTPDLPMVPVDLADYRVSSGDFVDRSHRLHGFEGPDADGHVAYVQGGYRHDELPHVIAWLTAVYRASTGRDDVDDDMAELDHPVQADLDPTLAPTPPTPPTTAPAQQAPTPDLPTRAAGRAPAGENDSAAAAARRASRALDPMTDTGAQATTTPTSGTSGPVPPRNTPPSPERERGRRPS